MLDKRDYGQIAYNILEERDSIDNYNGDDKKNIYYILNGLRNRLKKR
tara:strand:- start:779 stop:919 length:141 start_codon:yes stop_codon:yes gene_type:complete